MNSIIVTSVSDYLPLDCLILMLEPNSDKIVDLNANINSDDTLNQFNNEGQ